MHKLIARKYTSRRNDQRSEPEVWIRGDTENWSGNWKSRTRITWTYGIKHKIDSVQKDWTQSWLVMSRRVINTYRIFLKDHKPINFEDASSSRSGSRRDDRKNSLYRLLLQQRYRSINGYGTLKNIEADDQTLTTSRFSSRR